MGYLTVNGDNPAKLELSFCWQIVTAGDEQWEYNWMFVSEYFVHCIGGAHIEGKWDNQHTDQCMQDRNSGNNQLSGDGFQLFSAVAEHRNRLLTIPQYHQLQLDQDLNLNIQSIFISPLLLSMSHTLANLLLSRSLLKHPIYLSWAVSVTFDSVIIEKNSRDVTSGSSNSYSTVNFLSLRRKYVHSLGNHIQGYPLDPSRRKLMRHIHHYRP